MFAVIMILYPLGSFKSWIKQSNNRNLSDLISVVMGLFQALFDLHAAGIVHYDM